MTHIIDTEELRDKVGRIIGTAILKNDKNYTDDMMELILQQVTEARIEEVANFDVDKGTIYRIKRLQALQTKEETK